MFVIDDCKIRKAQITDLSGLVTMSKTIWEGDDYIPKIAEKWISDGHFFVAEYMGRIVGCVKISKFPDDVLWFEGLLVHGRFQGKGIGKLLNHYALEYAQQLKSTNPNLVFEFCTYYLNKESLHMAKYVGFKPIQKYYIFEKRGVRNSLEPIIVTDYDMRIFQQLQSHIPCGWQAIHNCPDSLYWLKSKCTVFQTPQGKYLCGGLSGKSILFLQAPTYDIKKELPYFQHFFGVSKSIEIIIPTKWKKYLSLIQSLGFKDWEGPVKRPNMLIFKM